MLDDKSIEFDNLSRQCAEVLLSSCSSGVGSLKIWDRCAVDKRIIGVDVTGLKSVVLSAMVTRTRASNGLNMSLNRPVGGVRINGVLGS